MIGLSDWKSSFAKTIGAADPLGKLDAKLGESTQLFFDKYEIANEYLTHLVPRRIQAAPPFIFFDSAEIEANLSGLSYSSDFQSLGFLPIGELENDKLICIDCDYPAFVVFQLGMGTIQPVRQYMLFRTTPFSDFLIFLRWKIDG